MPSNPFDDAWEESDGNPFDKALEDEPSFLEKLARSFGAGAIRAAELPLLASPLVSGGLALAKGELPGFAVRHTLEDVAKNVEAQVPGGTTMERIGEQIAGGLPAAAVNTGLQALGGPLATAGAGGYQAALSAYEQARQAGESPLSAGLGAGGEALVGAVAAPLAGAAALGKFAPQGAGLIRQLLTSGAIDAATGAGQTAATLGREALQGQEISDPVRQVLESAAANAAIGMAARGSTLALEPRSRVEPRPAPTPEGEAPRVPVTESVTQERRAQPDLREAVDHVLAQVRGLDDATLAQMMEDATIHEDLVTQKAIERVAYERSGQEAKRQERISVPSEVMPRIGEQPQRVLTAEQTPGEVTPPTAVLRGSASKPATTDDYVNVSKFKITDPSGEKRLRETVDRVVAEKGMDPKRVVTWDETRAAAEALGIGDVEKGQAERMTGPELLAARNITSSNIDDMVRVARELDNPDLEPKRRLELERRISVLDDQNSRLLERFIKGRSQKGRDLNNMKMVASLTSDPVLWTAKAMQWAGRKNVPPAVKVRIAELAASGDREGYYQLVSGLGKSTARERFMGFWKAGLVTNPLTHAVNVVSTNLNLAAEFGKDYAGSVMDSLMGAATKRRTLKGPSIAQAKALARGYKEGFPEAKRVLKGAPNSDALARFDFKAPLEYGNSAAGKMVAAYVNGTFRALGAEDRVARTAAFERGLQAQAELHGIDYDAAAQRVDLVAQAIADSEQATFQNETKVGQGLRGVAKFPLGELIVPFQKTPGAVATKVAEYSPVGLAAGLGRAGKVIYKAMRKADVPEAEQRYAAELVGRGVSGTALMGLGMYLRAKGIASPVQEREDKKSREMGMAAGVPGSALKIGDYWLEIGRLSPVGNMIAVGATLWDELQTEAPPSEVAAAVGASALKSVTDQPFVSGPRAYMEATGDPLKRGVKMVQNLAGSVIPAAVAGVARGTDPVMREVRGVEDSVRSRIPGLSKELPERLDVLGRPIPRDESVGLRLFDALLNPMQVTKERLDDPVMKELFRLDVKPPVPEDKFSINKKEYRLNQKQHHDYRAQVGGDIYKALNKLFASSLYNKANLEKQQQLVKSAIQKAADRSEMIYKRSYLRDERKRAAL